MLADHCPHTSAGSICSTCRDVANTAMTEYSVAIATMLREACDEWESSGDDEKLVFEVLDPWIDSVLG